MGVWSPGGASRWAMAGALACGITGLVVQGLVVQALAAPATVAEIANYAGSDRQRILEDGAKQEGTLTIYTTGTQIAPLVDRFKQKYPFFPGRMRRPPSAEGARKGTRETA